jgi:hypothetical protein
VEVFSDHQNLSYFTTAKILNRRQARWAQELSSYNFVINYRPGKLNGKADLLSRLEQYRPEKGGDKDQPIRTVLREEHFQRAGLEPKPLSYSEEQSYAFASISSTKADT